MRSLWQCCLAAVAAASLLSGVLFAQDTAADRHAGVEIGSKGVKFVLFEITESDGVAKAEEISGSEAETKNTALNDDATALSRWSEPSMTATIEAVKSYIEKAKSAGVPDDQIYVVGSSGLREVSNRAEFRDLLKKETGYNVDFIDHRLEVGLAFVELAPADSRAGSFSYDIGSGNTKFGYVVAEGDDWTPFAEQIAWGTGTFGTVVKESTVFTDGASAEEQAAEFAKQAAAERARLKFDSDLATSAERVDLNGRDRVYFSGGAVWAMTTIMHPEAALEIEVPLTADDVAAYRALVAGSTVDEIFAQAEEKLAGLPEDVAAKAKKELSTVRKVFATPKDNYTVPHAELISGAELIDASVKAFDGGSRTILFPRPSLTAWLRGYVLYHAKFNFSVPANGPKVAVEETVLEAPVKVGAEPGAGPAMEKEPAAPADDSAVAETIARLEKQIAALQKKLDQQPSVAPAALDELRKMIAENAQQIDTLARAVAASGANAGAGTSPAAPGRSATELARVQAKAQFREGVALYRAGRFADAYVSLCKASDAVDSPQYWYGRAVAAYEVGNQADFLAATDRVLQAMRSGSATYPQLCRDFESIQGAARVAVDEAIRSEP